MTDEERRREVLANVGRLMVLKQRIETAVGRRPSAVTIPARMFPLPPGKTSILGMPVVCGARWGLVFDV
jgi:hypothetical protein